MKSRPESAQDEQDEVILEFISKNTPPSKEVEEEQQSMAEQMVAYLASLRIKDSTTSPEPIFPQSPVELTIPSRGDQLLGNLLKIGTPMVNEAEPLSVTDIQSRRQALESNKKSLQLLDEIMRRQERKNPELAAKQARLLQILAKSSQQSADLTAQGPAGPPLKPQKPTA